MIDDIKLPWSDNWWIEGNRAWFCAGEISALFCVDLNSGKCDLVEWIPECNRMDFRLYSYCIKRDDIIFCIPNMGKDVWYFDIKEMNWGKIEVEHESQFVMCISAYSKQDNRIWLLEDEKGKIFEVDCTMKKVENKYQLPVDANKSSNEYILVGDKLYFVSGYKVYCINGNALRTYEITGVKTELCTICYDGCNFWLSGYCKDIYVWNPDQGIINVITEFPKYFGFYHFRRHEIPVVDCDSLFCDDFAFYISSIPLGKYIWYIPFRSNEIVYIDKETFEVHLLEIEDEQETSESIDRHIIAHKYLVQYVHENRYIGIYSLKNGWIFEIDTVELCVRKKDYKLSGNAFLSLAQIDRSYYAKEIFREKREKDRILFSALVDANSSNQNDELQNIGGLIYRTLDLL